MKKILKNKNIIITGTARGIGHSMVETFAMYGANIIAHARKSSDEHKNFCADISKKENVSIYPVYFDITKQDEIKEAFNNIRMLKIPIDGLINNAGIGGNSLFQMTRMEELRNIFETNFFGQFFWTQYIAKIMIRQKAGSIVNISSTSALDGNSGKSAYGSAKAALIALTKSIAEDFGASAIRANDICPGGVDTSSIHIMPDYIIDIEKEATYLGKLTDPVDVANLAAFLISDYSSYITGQVIRIDGGKTVYDKHKQ